MTRNVVIGAIAGAVGGYFAGRAVDKKVSHAYAPDSLTRSLAQAKAVESLPSLRIGLQAESNRSVGKCEKIQEMVLD
jgi:hypothetical protein